MMVLWAWRKYFCRFKYSLALVGAMGAATPWAGPAQAACNQIRCVDQIERLYLSRSANSLFISTAGDEAALNCSLAGGVYMTIPVDNPLFSEFLSMLLTAKASDYLANIRIHQGSNNCTVSYVVIEAGRAGEAPEAPADIDEVVEVD